MSMGTELTGRGTREVSGMGSILVSAGGGGARGGCSSGGGDGGGGGSKVMVSISRMVRSGVFSTTVNRRANPKTASSIAEAVMPMMMELNFKTQISSKRRGWGEKIYRKGAEVAEERKAGVV